MCSPKLFFPELFLSIQVLKCLLSHSSPEWKTLVYNKYLHLTWNHTTMTTIELVFLLKLIIQITGELSQIRHWRGGSIIGKPYGLSLYSAQGSHFAAMQYWQFSWDEQTETGVPWCWSGCSFQGIERAAWRWNSAGACLVRDRRDSSDLRGTC